MIDRKIALYKTEIAIFIFVLANVIFVKDLNFFKLIAREANIACALVALYRALTLMRLRGPIFCFMLFVWMVFFMANGYWRPSFYPQMQLGLLSLFALYLLVLPIMYRKQDQHRRSCNKFAIPIPTIPQTAAAIIIGAVALLIPTENRFDLLFFASSVLAFSVTLFPFNEKVFSP